MRLYLELGLAVLALLLTAILFWFKFRYSLQMLQQNGYLNLHYLKWCGQNVLRNLSVIELIAVPVSILFYVFVPQINFLLNLGITLLLVSAGNLPLGRYSLKRAKKPLVYTARVKRLMVCEGVLAVLGGLFFLQVSRLQGDWMALLFFVLFLTVFHSLFAAFANLVVRPIELLINQWYFHDAKRILKEMSHLKIIGITGSYGKTSSKYILTKLLSEEYHTLMTPESYNTPMGVVKTVRTMLKPTHQVFVCEMGAKYRKDIQELCGLVHPEYGLLTSVGPQHLETFKSMEHIVATKFDLVHSLKDQSKAIVNIENKWIRDNAPAEAVKYAVDKIEGADYWAEEISYGPSGVKFMLCAKTGERIPLESRLLGRHNILNIIGACAASAAMGLKLEQLIYPVKRLEPVPHRLELRPKTGGLTIIDDAFNSNIEGAKSAVEVLGSFPAGSRILITPGMVELGERSYELNKEFARHCGTYCDFIILIGKEQTRPLQAGLEEIKFPKEKLFVAGDLKEGFAVMRSLTKQGGTVLLENDLPDLYNEKLI